MRTSGGSDDGVDKQPRTTRSSASDANYLRSKVDELKRKHNKSLNITNGRSNFESLELDPTKLPSTLSSSSQLQEHLYKHAHSCMWNTGIGYNHKISQWTSAKTVAEGLLQKATTSVEGIMKSFDAGPTQEYNYVLSMHPDDNMAWHHDPTNGVLYIVLAGPPGSYQVFAFLHVDGDRKLVEKVHKAIGLEKNNIALGHLPDWFTAETTQVPPSIAEKLEIARRQETEEELRLTVEECDKVWCEYIWLKTPSVATFNAGAVHGVFNKGTVHQPTIKLGLNYTPE